MGRNNVKKSQKTVKIVSTRAIFTTFILAGMMFFLIENPRPYVLGLMVGSLAGVINFRLMAMSLSKSVKLSAKAATPVFSLTSLLRYLVYTLVLVLAVQTHAFNIVTVTMGFLIVKLVIISSVVFQRFGVKI